MTEYDLHMCILKWKQEVANNSIDRRGLLKNLADLNNYIAQYIMGWYIQSGDPRRLWREHDGSAIKVVIDGVAYMLCKHPYSQEKNHDFDRSYDVVFMHHKDHYCLRQMAVDKKNTGKYAKRYDSDEVLRKLDYKVFGKLEPADFPVRVSGIYQFRNKGLPFLLCT